MPALDAKQIRNAVLLAHSGGGKTSLAEAMLFAAGAIPRRGKVEEGNTTSDWEPEEARRRISLNLTPLPIPWRGHKINLLDTPGYMDFVSELLAGIRVAEGAVVVCPATGVEAGTEMVWNYTREAGLPRLLFINKMDRENADFFRTLDGVRSRLSPKAVPLQLPLGAEAEFKGVVDLITGKAYLGDGTEREPPASLAEAVTRYREQLVEAAVETDDQLLTRYLEGGEITPEEIRQGLAAGTARGELFPVLVGSALQGIGATALLDAILDYLPPPAPEGNALTALAFKTTADPYVGRLTYFRVYSGTITSNSQVWNPVKGQMERVGQLFFIRGKSQEPTPEVGAGDIGAVAKLSVTSTGDTLSARDHPVTLPPPHFPKPRLRLAVLPKSKADLDKMGVTLPRLLEDDPTLQIQREPDTGETLLVGMGDIHLEVAVERLQRKFGVQVVLHTPRVPYKETITVPIKADFRHKKQTGGHGQFGHVFLELEPLPRGSGVQFEDRIVGMALSRSYIPAVEKGVKEAASEGVIAGFPVVDVRAALYDGKEHPVDSSDICFKIAGASAFKAGVSQGQPVLLEPILRLRVTVPEGLTGDIIGDLNSKRARVLGMTPESGMNTIEALVPLAEVQRYVTDLKSLTGGRGTFDMEPGHYEEVPPHLTQRIIAERQAEKAAQKG